MHLTTHQLLFLLLQGLIAAVWANPTPAVEDVKEASKRSAAFQEKTPWSLTYLTVFEAKSGTSEINFSFSDENKGLRLTTYCLHTAPSGVSVKDEVYHSCANATVAFFYDGSRVSVRRYYIDPSVGPPSMDTVTAYGFNSSLDFCITKTATGTIARLQQLSVPVSMEVAK